MVNPRDDNHRDLELRRDCVCINIDIISPVECAT